MTSNKLFRRPSSSLFDDESEQSQNSLRRNSHCRHHGLYTLACTCGGRRLAAFEQWMIQCTEHFKKRNGIRSKSFQRMTWRNVTFEVSAVRSTEAITIKNSCLNRTRQLSLLENIRSLMHTITLSFSRFCDDDKQQHLSIQCRVEPQYSASVLLSSSPRHDKCFTRAHVDRRSFID